MKIKVYDYANEAKEIDVPTESIDDILTIIVTILSGDETGYIMLKNNEIISFDACSGYRISDFYDGGYILNTQEQIKKWLDYVPPENDKFSYSRQDYMWRAENDEL